MRTRPQRLWWLASLVLAATLATAGAAGAAAEPPWRSASDVRAAVAEAEKALLLAGPAEAVREARKADHAAGPLLVRLRRPAPDASARIARGLEDVAEAAAAGDSAALGAARAEIRTAILAGSYRATLAAIRTGDVEAARAWLLVREFRPPTRFSRAGVKATLALSELERRRLTRREALPLVRAELLDTYQGLLGAALDTLADVAARGFATRTAAEAALARGYFELLVDAYGSQRGVAAARAASASFDELASSALAGDSKRLEAASRAVDAALEAFRAAPLTSEEKERRAGQFLRFLALVPVEYGRGVDEGRVTLPFEIQEAITFRDGAAQALADLEPDLARAGRADAARMEALVAGVGASLTSAARGEGVAEPDTIETSTDEALALADELFPEQWKQAGASADFDVIRATLKRLSGAIAAGEYGRAEQARLEAYAFFEFGPEQRLRGIAPGLFVRVEGLFWYGADGHAGLAQLVRRKASSQDLAETSAALDGALAEAELRVGEGATSTTAVVTNTAVIVFREGLEAVLILAALAAGMTGAKRRFRRPLLLGAAGALFATAGTWVAAQTILGSLSRYGEKLEAIVSLIAIGILLLVLNWFYHRVYWNEHLASLQGRKKRLLGRTGMSVAAAQLLGLVALGFSSVYREGFETMLFLQALVLETGLPTVLLGVALGLLATTAVGLITIALERKLPYKRMLIATGVLITWVLVVMVGTTMQTLQVVGWVPVHPIPDLQLPYWAGLWLGVFPTWEGVLAQAAAAVVVVGSYFLAEALRKRRRRALLAEPLPARAVAEQSRVEQADRQRAEAVGGGVRR